MNRFVLIVAALFAVPALGAASKQNLLVMDLQTTGVDAGTSVLLVELITVKLSQRAELEVTSGADLQRLVELESEKYTAGCDDSSCLSDLAGALGARYVIFGRIGKLGSNLLLSLNLLDAKEGRAVQREQVQAPTVDALSAQIDDVLVALLAPLIGTQSAPPSASSNALALRLVAGGAATALGAYAASALWALATTDTNGNEVHALNYIPVAGPIMYGVDESLFVPDINRPVCIGAGVLQAGGLIAMVAGFFVGDPFAAEELQAALPTATRTAANPAHPMAF